MKNVSRIFAVVAVLAFVAVFAACGSSSSSSTTPNITTVDQLPRATSPVVNSATGNIAAPGKSLAKATAGIVMGTLSSSTFSQGQSMAACQAANQLRQVLEGAASADRILCYVQYIVSNDATGQLATIYDGNYHIFKLSISGAEEGSPDHVKMKIAKTGDVVTGFEMFACISGSQSEYLNQTITGTDISIVAKGHSGGGEWTGWHQVAVTGTLNTSGYYTAKTIDIDNSGSSGSNTNWNEATVNQYADNMTFNGYDAGSYGGSSYGNRVYSRLQLIDPNTSASNSAYNIQLIALGDGAAKGIYSSGGWSGSDTEGWNGDTKLEDATTAATWITQVQDTTPMASATAPTIAFAVGSEKYECNGTEEVTVTADETAMNAACTNFTLGHQWFDCYAVIQPTF